MADLLTLLKLKMGIMHNLLDARFQHLLNSCQNELGKMVELDLTKEEDQNLIIDYAEHAHRHAHEPISDSIKFRIKNRMIQKAGASINAEP